MEKRKISTTIRLANISCLLEDIQSYSFQVSYSLDNKRKSVELPSSQQIQAKNEEKDYLFTGSFKAFIENAPKIPVVISANIEFECEETARAIVPFIQLSGRKVKVYKQKKNYADYFFQDSEWLDSQIIRTVGVPII